MRLTGDSVALAGDRWLAMRDGVELAVHDLSIPGSSPFVISEVANSAIATSGLVVSDPAGGLRCYRERDGTWRATAQYSLDPVIGAESPGWTHLKLSPSGRYLLLESMPNPRGHRYMPRARALLMDLDSGVVLRTLDLWRTAVRGSFATLPNDREVLFVSAESYMSVQMIDCLTGATMHEYVYESTGGFCHTNYELTADATRLVIFGCFWGSPYEARIYDTAPWIAGGTPSSLSPLGFPLPIIYRQEEVFDSNDMILPIELRKSNDGNLTCVALVDMDYLRESLTEDDGDDPPLRERLTGTDVDMFDALLDLPIDQKSAIVIRRVNPVTGVVEGWFMSPIGTTYESHVHTLSDHRVLLLNERIQLVDGLEGTTIDLGPTGVEMNGKVRSLVTDDGNTIVIRESRGPGTRGA